MIQTDIIKLNVNGKVYKVLVEPHDTLSKVLREKIFCILNIIYL